MVRIDQPSSRHNAAVPVIKPEYGPTLLQLLAPRPLALRLAVAALAAALVVAAGLAIASRPDETAVLVREPVTFNFAYGPQFERVARAGALVFLRHDDGTLFLDSYAVRPLTLPSYRGAAAGVLPVYADGYLRTLRRRYAKFELVGEGRARINNAIGYQLTFRALSGTGRRLYGGHLLLVEEDVAGLRRGVVIELESTPRPARRTPRRSATTAR